MAGRGRPARDRTHRGTGRRPVFARARSSLLTVGRATGVWGRWRLADPARDGHVELEMFDPPTLAEAKQTVARIQHRLERPCVGKVVGAFACVAFEWPGDAFLPPRAEAVRKAQRPLRAQLSEVEDLRL